MDDIFSVITDDTCLMAILLYTGPRPRSIGALFFASPFVRQRLSTSPFARKFLSLYLGVNIPATMVDISWWDELKQWFSRRNELYDLTFDFHGVEVDQLERGDDEPIVSVKKSADGTVRAERVFKAALPGVSFSEAVIGTFADLPMTIMQPHYGKIATLPLSRAHSMYYEVKVSKTVPPRSGAIIGYALPTLKTTLPGRTFYSVSVALDTLLAFYNPLRFPDKIPSPRGDTFKLKKGDTFGVGLIYSLSDTPPPYEAHISNEERTTPHMKRANTVTFYVTFNGQMLYFKSDILCPYQLTPTVILPTFGDALRINFGVPTIHACFFQTKEQTEALKHGNHNISAEPVSFYDMGWKFDPNQAYNHLPSKCYTDTISKEAETVASNDASESILSELQLSSIPKVNRNFYWQSLQDQEISLSEPTAVRLWLDRNFQHFGPLHQCTLDYLNRCTQEENYLPPVKFESLSACLNAINYQTLATGNISPETARTLLLSVTSSETLQFLLDMAPEDTVPALIRWCILSARNAEYFLVWDFISFLKHNESSSAVRKIDHHTVLFCYILSDCYQHRDEVPESPVYSQIEPILRRWHRGDVGAAGRDFLNSASLAFWFSRVDHVVENTWTYKKPMPSAEFLGAHWATHTLMSFGLLPREDNILPSTATTSPLTKKDIGTIYYALSEPEQNDLLQAVVCAFFCCLCSNHAPTSQTEPWLPLDPIDAIEQVLDLIMMQRSKFRHSEEFRSDQLSASHVFEVTGLMLGYYRMFTSGSEDLSDLRYGKGTWSRSSSTDDSPPLSLDLPINPALTYLESVETRFHFSCISDRFDTFMGHLSAPVASTVLSPQAAAELQNYVNEKCSWLNFWFGEERLASLFQLIFPDVSTSILSDYKILDIYGRPYDIKLGPYQVPIASTPRWSFSRLTMGVVAVGLVSAGIAISAVAFTRARRIFATQR